MRTFIIVWRATDKRLRIRLLNAALVSVWCALFGCQNQLAEAIVSGTNGLPCVDYPGNEECSADVWPNEYSRTNSDPWLPVYHDELREIRPRVLIVHFINDISVDELREAAERQIEALAEGSRYHGYKDPSAPAFLRYEIADIVDLTDDPVPAGWQHPSSTAVPLDDAGVFDVETLFSSRFARLLNISNPAIPGEVLDLCGLFNGGHINELWLAVADSENRHPPSMLECKPRYDIEGRRVKGEYVSNSEYRDFCRVASTCGVTVRIAHLNPMRGLGCDLEVRSWALRDSYNAIAYLYKNARAFLNADFGERFGTSFDRFDDICTREKHCVSYPEPTIAEGILADGTPWRIDPYEPGCGGPEYPPNARFLWDWESPQPVQTRCAHYGLRDGPAGSDLYEIYSSDTVAEATERWGVDCAGGWQMYWRQSIPGLDNPAFDADDQPMKNWWVFSFY
ncbi:MAG: hypothetical protein JXA30_00990 [Deltaproteobacteria bacterium]|nr:hypothetical protein [Deltaproteobacteria bacterium]